MPISNDEQLIEALRRINEDVKDVQKYLNTAVTSVPSYKLKFAFPSGYMRGTEKHRAKYWFIRDHTLRSNISYNLVFYDLLRWVNERIQLHKPADNMVIKHMIIIIGAVCEVLALQVAGKGKFVKLITRLKEKGIIDGKLEAELDWLRQARNLIHYDKQDKYELSRYQPLDLQRAVEILEQFTQALSDHCESDPAYVDLKKFRDTLAT